MGPPWVVWHLGRNGHGGSVQQSSEVVWMSRRRPECVMFTVLSSQLSAPLYNEKPEAAGLPLIERAE